MQCVSCPPDRIRVGRTRLGAVFCYDANANASCDGANEKKSLIDSRGSGVVQAGGIMVLCPGYPVSTGGELWQRQMVVRSGGGWIESSCLCPVEATYGQVRGRVFGCLGLLALLCLSGGEVDSLCEHVIAREQEVNCQLSGTRVREWDGALGRI